MSAERGRRIGLSVSASALLGELLFCPQSNLVMFLTMAALCVCQQLLVAATMAQCMGTFYK